MLKSATGCLFFLIICLYPEAQNKRLSVIGSSTAAGTGAVPLDSSWVKRLNYYYKYQVGFLDSTYNIAVSGSSHYEGMPTGYIPPPGKPAPQPDRNISRALTFSPHVVIVSYPSNRFNVDAVSDILFCLQTIFNSATSAGKRCFVTTSQPRHDGDFATSATKRKMAIMKDSIINRFGMYSINFWDGLYNPADTTIHPAYSAGDQIHLNNSGHRLLFERVLAKNIFDTNLPVIVKNFTAILVNKQVNIKWNATNEEDHTEYFLQRSFNGSSFETIKSIKARGGQSENMYEHIDMEPYPGSNFYRLEIKSPGRTFFSTTITLKNPIKGIVIRRLFPVPSSSFINIELVSTKKENGTIEIIMVSGERIRQLNFNIEKEETLVTIPINNLRAGNYLLRIHATGSDPIIQSFIKY